MTKRMLNAAEIALVDSWIKKRGLYYEDVRIEILDHVVCAMEDLMQNDPQLSLENAFQMVHASFGIFGFASVEDAFIRSKQKYIWRSIAKQLLYFIQPIGWLFSGSLVLMLLSIQTVLGNSSMLLIPVLVSIYFIVRRIGMYRRAKELRNHLAFRMALSVAFMTTPAAIYLFTMLAKSTPSSVVSGIGLFAAAALCMIEYAQWMVLCQETDKNHQLLTKLKRTASTA